MAVKIEMLKWYLHVIAKLNLPLRLLESKLSNLMENKYFWNSKRDSIVKVKDFMQWLIRMPTSKSLMKMEIANGQLVV